MPPFGGGGTVVIPPSPFGYSPHLRTTPDLPIYPHGRYPGEDRYQSRRRTISGVPDSAPGRYDQGYQSYRNP